MLAGFDTIAERAAHYTWELVLEDVPAAELPALGQEGKVVLISRYLPQLRKLVNRAAGADAAEREDLESAAVLGFLDALSRFDADRSVDPLTFAYTSIESELKEANRTSAPRPVEESAHARFWRAMRLFPYDPYAACEWSALQRMTGHDLLESADDGNAMAREIVDARIARYESAGDDVDVKLASAGRGLTRKDFMEVYTALNYVSLDTPAEDGDSEDPDSTIGDLVPSESASNDYAGVEARMAVEALLREVSDRDAAILRGLFGIGCAEQSAAELAEQFGMRPDRVRGVRRDALVRMRAVAE